MSYHISCSYLPYGIKQNIICSFGSTLIASYMTWLEGRKGTVVISRASNALTDVTQYTNSTWHPTSLVLHGCHMLQRQQNQLHICSEYETESCGWPSVVSQAPGAKTFERSFDYHSSSRKCALLSRVYPPSATSSTTSYILTSSTCSRDARVHLHLNELCVILLFKRTSLKQNTVYMSL